MSIALISHLHDAIILAAVGSFSLEHIEESVSIFFESSSTYSGFTRYITINDFWFHHCRLFLGFVYYIILKFPVC